MGGRGQAGQCASRGKPVPVGPHQAPPDHDDVLSEQTSVHFLGTLRPTRGRVLALTAQIQGREAASRARRSVYMSGSMSPAKCQPGDWRYRSHLLCQKQPLPCSCHPHELHRRRRNWGGRRGFLWEDPGLAVQSSGKPLLGIWPVPGRGGSASCSPHLSLRPQWLIPLLQEGTP